MSGFFKKKQERIDPSDLASDASLHPRRSGQYSTNTLEQAPASIAFEVPPIIRHTSETAESKSFFRIPRRKKASSIGKDESNGGTARQAERNSVSIEHSRLSLQSVRSPFEVLLRPSMSARASTVSNAPSLAGSALMAAGTSLAAPASPMLELKNPLEANKLSRQSSRRSIRSFQSAQSIPRSERSGNRPSDLLKSVKSRGRSLTYAGNETQRKASSASRPSKFFSLGRLRKDNDDVSLFRTTSRDFSPPPPQLPPSTSPLRTERPRARTSPELPPRLHEESACVYLERLSTSMHNTLTASALATSDSAFHSECLKLYMQHFDFVGDPLDMALRKLLMDTHLPKETQQIDRVLNAFSERYLTCNPRLYSSQVTPYVLSFALIMLHTDRFNQNNKNKMTKSQFLKNTTSEHTSEVSKDVLEYFYDNIISTPFILVEDESDATSVDRSGPTTPNEIVVQRNGSHSTLSVNQTTTTSNNTFGRRSLDLYPLIMEDKLSTLRPQLGTILEHDQLLSYTGTLPVINVAKLHTAFTHPAILQLVSARSRPEAFVDDQSTQNPLDTDPGLVDIQITKIGVLKRKEQKKPGSKPVYREWGVMLTPSQLLLFKNVAWVKHYQNQVREHQARREALILTPPVQHYSPDTYLPTSDTVAMFDSSASKKATHFSFFGRGGEQTHLAASSEEEMNDWVSKINYAAAFQTVGVRIRGIGSPTEAAQSPKRLHRHTSSSTVSTILGGHASQHEIIHARQEVMRTKIQEIEHRLKSKEQHLALLHQHARNLCTLTPIQPRTRATVISAAGSLSAQISWARMELTKTQCHRDILAKDLELEIKPSASVYTIPMRAKTPPPGAETPKTSPSKIKLGSAVGSIMRQVSTDTLKRVHRKPVPDIDLSRRSKAATSASEASLKIPAGCEPLVDQPWSGREHGLDADFRPDLASLEVDETSSNVLSNIPPSRISSNSSTVLTDNGRPRTAPSLKLNLSLGKRGKFSTRNRADNDPDESSLLSSPSSNSSGQFMLHGRKVSVVQTPASLLTSPRETAPSPSHSDDSASDIFLDADDGFPPVK